MKILLQIITIYFLFTNISNAASIIRDAEIENELLKIAQPIFAAAGLKKESIKLYVVNNKEINAYVSGGSNIFIHTGLLGLSDKPDILRGVLAHETGHIAGGHLLINSQEYRNSSIKTTLGYMVGLAAAAAMLVRIPVLRVSMVEARQGTAAASAMLVRIPVLRESMVEARQGTAAAAAMLVRMLLAITSGSRSSIRLN